MAAQRAFGIAVLVCTVATGCVSFDEVHCANGIVCPPGSHCDDASGTCVSAQQVAACSGLADGETCNFGGAQGTCTGGACVPWFCGDGIRNGGEGCDGSDLGVDNTGTAVTCTTLGYYDDAGLACSPYCRYDVSACTGYCGDGVVNGPELCDSAPPRGQSCLDFSFDAGRLACTLCAPGYGGCTHFGWQPVVSPTVKRLRGIWGAASDDFFVVGLGGTVLHYDGTDLAPVAVTTTEDLYAVWGSAAGDAFVVGNAGTILHFDGSAFTPMTSPVGAQFQGVWGAAANDVYAVGTNGTIVHYDGATWADMTLAPAPPTLHAVWGSSASNVYAVGASGTVLRYDGTQWSNVVTPFSSNINVDLEAVWGSGSNDVFVTGLFGTNGLVIHYDGIAWTRVDPVPPFSGAYRGVWGSSSAGVMVVGFGLLANDGSKWTKPILPPEFQQSTFQMWAIWGSPTGDIWSVGENGYVGRWGGASWTQPPPVAPSVNLRAVSSLGPSDAIAVGFSGQIFRYDGVNWATMASPTANSLYSVWTAGQTFAVAVGQSTILQFDGASWRAQTCPATISDLLLGVWGNNNSDVHAVGFAGAAWHYDGACWSSKGPTGADLYAASGTTTDVFASGATAGVAAIRQFSSTWSTVALPPPAVPNPLSGIWSAGPNETIAVGAAIFRYDGSVWAQTTDASHGLHAVSGTGPRNVFAVGDSGKLLHYDGVGWTPMTIPTVATLRGVAATSRSLIVVGDGGVTQRLAFSLRPTEINCRDAWDDDGDGLPDCADPDCSSDQYCTHGGTCPFIKDVSCGDTITGSTLGRTPSRDYYTCDANPETGGEAIYRFVPPATASATATLSGFAPADLDLVVLGAMAATDACDPDFACLGASSTANATETVTFTTTAARPYFLVVDGRNASAGPFTLAITCP